MLRVKFKVHYDSAVESGPQLSAVQSLVQSIQSAMWIVQWIVGLSSVQYRADDSHCEFEDGPFEQEPARPTSN